MGEITIRRGNCFTGYKTTDKKIINNKQTIGAKINSHEGPDH